MSDICTQDRSAICDIVRHIYKLAVKAPQKIFKMRQTTKFLLSLLVLGIIYSLIKLFTGKNGIGLTDSIDGIVLTSVLLFFCALIILIYNHKILKTEVTALVFLIISFPLTFLFLKGVLVNIESNKNPDLKAKYSRPVSSKQFIKDSLNIQNAITSLVKLRNEQTGGIKVEYAIIDTIIYSPKADKIWVSYIKKFEPNDYGNNFDTYTLQAEKRNVDIWELTESGGLIGSYESIENLKYQVRKYYFNTYSFDPKESKKENYFWK